MCNRQAFVDVVKTIDLKWKPGKPIPSGALNGITRESIDNSFVKAGGSLVKKPYSAEAHNSLLLRAAREQKRF